MTNETLFNKNNEFNMYNQERRKNITKRKSVDEWNGNIEVYLLTYFVDTALE